MSEDKTNDNRQETSDLTKELGSLINALDNIETTTARKLAEGTALQMEDLTNLAREHLSADAQEAMTRRSKTLVVKGEDGRLYQCTFLAKTVKNSDIAHGVKEICRDLNVLARAGLIHSCLAPVSSIALAKMPGKELSSIVLSYVLVPSVQQARELLYNAVSESYGNDGSQLADLELPDGEFIAIERISLAMTSLTNKTMPSESGQIHGRIQQYLAILPQGTEVLSITRCAITDLSTPYEIRFRNPLMAKFTEVAIEYVRDFEVIDGSLKQFSRVTGVTYKRRNQEIA